MTGALEQLATALGRSTSLQDVVRVAVEETRVALRADVVGMARLQEESDPALAGSHVSSLFLARIPSLPLVEVPWLREVIRRQGPVALPTAHHPEIQTLLATEGILHLAMAPVLSGGRIVGALGAARREDRAFDSGDLETLGGIGRLLGLALEKAGAHEQAQASTEAQEDARLAHERLTLVTRATNDALWDWDCKTDSVWRSLGVESLFGYSVEEAGSDPRWWEERLHPEDRERILAHRDAIKLGGSDLWEHEYRFCRKDGQYALVRDRGYVMRDASGRAVRMTGSMMDVTRERAAEEALRAVREDLEKRVQERTAELVAANASLQKEIAERERAEEAVREQLRLASFAAGIGAALSQAESLDDALRRCAEAMARHLDAALARIWLLDGLDADPILRASAGILPDLSGPPCHAISAIARAQRPHITASMENDPLTCDTRWILKLGLHAFAGYPLVVEDQVVGVMALFADKPFAEASLNALLGVATQIALGITRKVAADALRTTHMDLERRVHERTAALREEIAERKRAEQGLMESQDQLRQLAAKLERVREEERTRIAREIHDELGQALAALKLDLSSLKRVAPPGAAPTKGRRARRTALDERVEAMAGLVDRTVQIVRRISAELRPAVLDSLGLAAAMEWQAQEFERRTDIRCVFRSTLDDEAIPREVATATFRILQETLANVARHAEAGWVAVNLGFDEKGLLALDVTDDGKGITEEALSSTKSAGLAGMRERALLLGGGVQIEGRPGQGTTVRLHLPITRPKEGASL